MIQIRPSDVMFKLADVLRDTSKAAGFISRDLYEADRVSQVNRQLAYLEQTYQQYNESLPQKMFDVRGELEITGPSGGQAPSVVQKEFGQASLADVEADEEKFFQAQLEYITKNTTNKAARREMIQHLTMKHIQNQGIIARQWNVAADHEAMAGLNTLYSTVLASNEPWEEKVRKISTRVDQMVRTGRLWKDEGEEIKAKATAAAQYSFAHNGAMAMMKDPEGGLAAGEAWLKQNTPFYDGNPDARASVLDDVRREFDYFARTEDEKLDVLFADLYVNIDTVEKADMALATLRDTHFYDGDKKYTWEQRLMARREYQLNMQDVPAGTMDDWLKGNADNLWGLLAISVSKEDVPRGDLKQIVYDMFYHPEGPRIRGSDVKAMLAYLDEEQDPAVKVALRFLESKGAGLSDKERMTATNKLLEDIKRNPQYTTKDIEQAVINIVDPVVKRNLEAWFSGTVDVVVPDKFKLSEAERLTGDIQNDLYIGLIDERKAYLAGYNALMMRIARRSYPHLGIVAAYTDSTGDISGHPGTAILLDANMKSYVYKLEDKQLIFYSLSRTRGGTYVWQKVVEPGTAKAEETAIEMKEAEAKAAAREQARKELIEGTKTPGRGRGGR